MSKHSASLKYVYKIRSSRLRKAKWNLTLSIEEAMRNEEIVALADSTALRFISEIEHRENQDPYILIIRNQIHALKLKDNVASNKKKISSLYKKLYEASFLSSYLSVIIDNNQDYDRLNSKKGFYLNGIKYKRLLATTSGAKNSTVVFINSEIYEELNRRIDNGRNMNKPFVPARLEAYKSLVCSASIPMPHPNGILVVNDCETSFFSNVIEIDDSVTKKYPKMRYKENYDITLNESDGYGLILPSLSEKWAKQLGENYIPSGFCIRNAFTKGMLFTFDFHAFAEQIAKSYIVKDIWGNERDIRRAEIILTASMLKLWDSYDHLEHYLHNCKQNNYTFSVTKVTPETLEDERNLNYQFIQSLDLSDEQITALITPTLKEIHDILGLDPYKSILFLNGKDITANAFYKRGNDFSKALMADSSVIHDPFIRNKIYGMIKKRINDAKVGVVKVAGNFSTISGDPFSLCQNMFGMEVTGLLRAGSFYSKYWNDKNVSQVACFRAPMTCAENIRILHLENTPEMSYWYKYMDTVTIFNSWDTTTHALNGADKDGDAVLTTNNKVLLDSIEKLPAIVCVQKIAEKKIVTEADAIQANKNSFGDEIGKVTNRITSMFDVRAKFPKESKEYKTLTYRIQCGQNYQQNAIDKAKGINSKDMPKEWYDRHAAVASKDRDMNLRILADKKPYFFGYIYPELLKQYRSHVKAYEMNSRERFRIGLSELIAKEERTLDEQLFIQNYYDYMPLSISKSVMNRLCWMVEDVFDRTKEAASKAEFDYSMYKTMKPYSKKLVRELSDVLEKYQETVKSHSLAKRKTRMTEDESQSARMMFKQFLKQEVFEKCSNKEDACNILLDLCYRKNATKQIVWDICGDQIILNLLEKKGHTITYPRLDQHGGISFGGSLFSLETTYLKDLA
ncbi:hypothetical protein ACE3MQ_09295 [Paenibacillus lentus]|uniref:RNA dependent RNA polymerase n=1 Tax=Paenibacillus lentus TaxID=1338368 RepID=UPI00364A475E